LSKSRRRAPRSVTGGAVWGARRPRRPTRLRAHRTDDSIDLGAATTEALYPISCGAGGNWYGRTDRHIHAEGYRAGEMKHGPIALIDKRMPVVAIAPVGPVYEKMASNIEEVKARDGIIVAVVTEGDGGIGAKADVVISPSLPSFTGPAAAGRAAAPAPCLPPGSPAGTRRGSAPEPRQERDGGVMPTL
jgi:SIS domain